MLSMIRHPAALGAKAPPLIIVHGLYGSARNWNVIARRLADQRDVIAVDQRNHGESPRYDSQSYADMAGDIAEVIENLGGKADVLGHSMGGKAAMQLALSEKQPLIRRLVIADIAPVAYDHDQSQFAAAMQAMDLVDLSERREADRRLAAAGIDDPALRAFFLQSLDLKASPPRWRLNLPVLSREMPKIVGWPGTAGQFDGSALFLTGSESSYVRTEHRPLIRAAFPRARFAKLPGAGHWLHADRPREFEETLRIFLDAPAS
jgi:esterase